MIASPQPWFTDPGFGRSVSPVAAIIWQRFGPYHLARLSGAARALVDSGWTVVGLEVAGRDEYAWDSSTDESVQRRTLFPKANYVQVSSAAIRRAVERVLTELKPHAVCVNGWAGPEAVTALRWARRAGARTVLMSETFESAFNPFKRTVRRWRAGRCDAALVGGRLQAGYLRQLGFDPDAVALGYDVVDNAHFARPEPAPPPWVPRVPARRYFFANTRLLERKGIDALLRAYAGYRAMAGRPAGGEPWQLVISGSGEMERRWKALASELGIAGAVHWPGFLQYGELPGAYQYAGAFVHPARREPWGLVVNEAAAAGLPLLVGRRVGAACELLRDGENGFLIDPDAIESFSGRLLRIADMADHERAAMGRHSQDLVANFGPERFGCALRWCLRLEP